MAAITWDSSARVRGHNPCDMTSREIRRREPTGRLLRVIAAEEAQDVERRGHRVKTSAG